MRRCGFALLLVSIGICVGGGAAGAQDLGCDEVVRDPGGVLDDRIAVEAAATDLAATHALRVRVRVEPSLDGGVNARMAQLESICPGWAPNGLRAEDIFVVMVAPAERQTGVYYGAKSNALDGLWESVQTDVMNPNFKAGSYAQGLTDGLSVFAGMLSGQVAPEVDDPPSVAGATPVVVEYPYQDAAPVILDGNSGFQSVGFPASSDDGFGAISGIFVLGVVGAIGIGIVKAASGGSINGGTTGRRRNRTFGQGMAASTMFNDQHHQHGTGHDAFGGGHAGGHSGGISGGNDAGGGGGSTSW